jgi:hypothetical protein
VAPAVDEFVTCETDTKQFVGATRVAAALDTLVDDVEEDNATFVGTVGQILSGAPEGGWKLPVVKFVLVAPYQSFVVPVASLTAALT